MELKVAQYGPSTTHWDLASVPPQAIEPIAGPTVLSAADSIDIENLRAETISTYPVFDEGKYVMACKVVISADTRRPGLHRRPFSLGALFASHWPSCLPASLDCISVLGCLDFSEESALSGDGVPATATFLMAVGSTTFVP